MTDRKPVKVNQKQPIFTASKTAVDSSHKKTAPKPRFPQSSQSNRKNLMAEFERAEAETRAKENRSKLQSQAISSINESSISSSQLIEEIGRSVSLREEDYAFQLPRSYILAMSGLQEAIMQRDTEIKRFRSQYEGERNIRVQLENTNLENSLKIKQNQLKIAELTTQIKVLKQNATDDRQTFAQLERNRLQLQSQLALSKQTYAIQCNSHQKMLLQLKTQLQKVQQEYVSYKNENSRLTQAAVCAHKELQMLKRSQQEQREKVKTLVTELSKQKEKRKEAEEQINILKKQAELLAQRTIDAQNQQKQVLIQEAIIRKPLLDIPILANQDRRESLSRKAYHFQYPEKKMAEKMSQEIGKKMDMLNSASKGAHYRKPTDGSMLSRDRSSSRVRPQQNCPELVSQYRQLMRHQKQLIGLNYQLQLLEKDMARQGDDKGELQKSYQKLRRECQQKQMQIRELKSFLNDPLK